MTPERARKLASRWTLGSLVPIVALLVLSLVGFVQLNMPLTFVGWLCVTMGVSHGSWVRGFEARDKREAKDAE